MSVVSVQATNGHHAVPVALERPIERIHSAIGGLQAEVPFWRDQVRLERDRLGKLVARVFQLEGRQDPISVLPAAEDIELRRPMPTAPGSLRAEADHWRARFESLRELAAEVFVVARDLEAEARMARPIVRIAPRVEPPKPFTFGPYTLYEREVTLKQGGHQAIHYFAKNKPATGKAVPMPAGFEVVLGKRTGLPFLRRLGAHRASVKAKHYMAQCAALTHEGPQCTNSARHGSKYCSAHVAYHPRTAKGLVALADTRPVVKGAPDTTPILGGMAHKVNGKRMGAAGLHAQCRAFTEAGLQCRSSAREESHYCAAHRFYRPVGIRAFLKRRDTKPRVAKAVDTKPTLRVSA